MTPPSRQKLIDCANLVAPWVADKIVNIESRIKVGGPWLETNCAVVSATRLWQAWGSVHWHRK